VSAVVRVRFRPRKLAEPTPLSAEPPHITQDDHGRWSLGWGDDAPGDFPSRKFARDYWLGRRTTQMAFRTGGTT
jgi:hypothetical protein